MKNMVNLLPATFRRQQIIRSRVYQWSAIVSAVLLAAWISHWYELREQRVMTQRLEVLTREHQPTQLMLRQLVEMRQKLVDLEVQERIARELEHQRNALTVLGVISEATQQTKGRLRVAKMELKNFQEQQATQVSSSTVGESGGLYLEGVSLDNPAVADLLEKLQDSSIFSRVNVALKERQGNDTSLRNYEVRCEF